MKGPDWGLPVGKIVTTGGCLRPTRGLFDHFASPGKQAEVGGVGTMIRRGRAQAAQAGLKDGGGAARGPILEIGEQNVGVGGAGLQAPEGREGQSGRPPTHAFGGPELE